MKNIPEVQMVFASAREGTAVTKSDDTVLDFHALYVGTGGTVVVKHYEGGPSVEYANVQDGTILPVAGVRVMVASTASNIVALSW